MKGRFEHIVSVVILNKKGEVYTAKMRRDADNRLAHDNERHFIGGGINCGETPEQAAINRVFEKTKMVILLNEALSTTSRSEQLPDNGGTRTVTTYWFIASLINTEENAGMDTSGDIEEGHWNHLAELCCTGNDYCIGDVAWSRTPVDLLIRTFKS